jgi:hypothetical protein
VDWERPCAVTQPNGNQEKKGLNLPICSTSLCGLKNFDSIAIVSAPEQAVNFLRTREDFET